MQINYCDLCGQPLKENNYYMLYVTTPATTSLSSAHEYEDTIKSIQKDIKEICPTCKHIFDSIFELRLKKLCELTEEINKNYQLPAKNKKNDKKKKK